MGRLLVLVLLVVLAVWLVRRALRKASRSSAAPGAITPDDLVQCAHCGVHLPRGEARGRDGASYCSEEHARLGKR